MPFMKSNKNRNYSIINMGSVQSYIGIPYRSYSDALRAILYDQRNIQILTVQPG